jgi:hypothetical protein
LKSLKHLDDFNDLQATVRIIEAGLTGVFQKLRKSLLNWGSVPRLTVKRINPGGGEKRMRSASRTAMKIGLQRG